MIVIGSYAAKLNGLQLRERIKDLDLLGSLSDLDRFRSENAEFIVEEEKTYKHRYRFKINSDYSFRIVEFDTEQSASDMMLMEFCNNESMILNSNIKCPSLEVLYLIKRAHANVPHTYDKTISDLIRIKKHIGDPSDQQLKFYKTRKRECAERFSLNRQRFILSIPNDEFFSVSNHIRFYVHDDFHEAVAHTPGKPLYKECKKDLSIAKIEVGLFKKLSPENQLAMVQEEFMVIGLERYYLNDQNLSPKAVYEKGMHKTIKDLFVGYFQNFCIDHIHELLEPPAFNFVDRFNVALREGRVRLLEASVPPVNSEHKRAAELIKQGQLGEARRICEDMARRGEAGGDPHAFYLLGMVFFNQKDYPTAERCLRKSLSRHRANAEAWMRLGIICRISNRSKEAIRCLRQALALNLDLFTVHANLGMALEAEGLLAEAGESFDAALKVKPDAPEIRRRREAIRARAVALGPDVLAS